MRADLLATARRLLRRALTGPAPAADADTGRAAILTGAAAADWLEATLEAGHREAWHGGGEAIARAMGRSLGGLRAAAFLEDGELAGARGALAEATRRRLPLVVHAVGGGGEWSGCGAVVLAPASVQEVVDLGLAARRLAELALAPVVVLQDPALARSLQEVVLPSASLLAEVVGEAGDEIAAVTPAQESLLGSRRRRVPRGCDPQRPLRLGAVAGAAGAAAAAAAGALYFDSHVPELLERALQAVCRTTGRQLTAVDAYRTADAEVVLVTWGAAVEVAEGVCDHLREEHRSKLGVVGLRALAPFPAAAALAALVGRRRAVVLEGAGGGPLAGAESLAAALRVALEAAAERPRGSRAARWSEPGVQARSVPELLPVRRGTAGPAPAAADLAALLRRAAGGEAVPPWLGLGARELAAWPKRQAARDALAAYYPELPELGLRAAGAAAELRPAGAVTVALAVGGELDGLAEELALQLHSLLGGHLRGAAASAERGEARPELLTWAPAPLRTPGSDAVAELCLLVTAAHHEPSRRELAALAQTAAGGTVLLAGAEPALSAAVADAARERHLTLWHLPLPAQEPAPQRRERLLGALVGALERDGRAAINLRKLLASRRTLLAELEEAERQARLDALAAGFAGAERLDPGTATGARGEAAPARAPAAARHLASRSAATGSLGDLAGFWDRVASLYRAGTPDDLVPEPALALPAEPAASAALCASSEHRTVLPAFDPEACTGCGACWSSCPDGAVGAWTASGAALVEHGMALAREGGGSADALRMVAAKLAEAVDAALGERAGASAGALLAGAGAAVLARSPLPAERKAAVTEALELAAAALGDLPLARTDPFFDQPRANGERPEALVLAIDPERCQGCGICVAECAPMALAALADEPNRTVAAARVQAIAAPLTLPAAATVERARRHPEVGALAGALLAAEAREVMVGGDGAEAGSGARLAVRQALGAAAVALAAPRATLSGEVGELRQALAAEIHGQLGRALPDQDLGALAAALEGLERPEAGLDELARGVGTPFEAARLEVPRLRRLVASGRAVTELGERLGEDGVAGRGAFSLVVAPSGAATWAGRFPANPFTVPVAVAPRGGAVALARGLAEAAVAAALAEARTLRQGRLELERPGEAAHAEPALAALGWRDLTPSERRLATPVLLLADERALSTELAALLELLAGELPVAVLALAEDEAVPDLATVARTLKRPLVAESSPGAPEHLAAAAAAAVAGGPALLRLDAPSPERGGFPSGDTVARARQALEQGRFTLSLRPAPAGEAQNGGDEAAESPEPPPSAEEHAAAIAALEARHGAELAALRAAFAAQAESERATMRVELARRLRGRLLALTARTPAEAPGEERR